MFERDKPRGAGLRGLSSTMIHGLYGEVNRGPSKQNLSAGQPPGWERPRHRGARQSVASIVIGLENVIQLNYIGSEEIAFMAAKALVQTRIDADVKEQATIVLENMGLTVSDAVRILLTRTAKEGALPIDLLTNSEVHDAWFRAKVREALEDKRPDIDDATVDAHFAERRAAALRKAQRRS